MPHGQPADLNGDRPTILVAVRDGTLARVLLGSTTAALLHRADTPVLVVPRHAKATEPRTRETTIESGARYG